jgi:8-oxo-dGTP pyrophosphatase MutT (NUDIX family)
VIVWVNGAFGVGKTSTVRELQALLPGSSVFDPESVGEWLRALLPPGFVEGLGDCQNLVSWRRLVPEAAAALLAELEGPLLVPMTVLRQDYRDEIFGALAARRIAVHHVVLHADETILRKRIEGDEVDRGARDWRLDQLDGYRTALDGWLRADAQVVETDELTPCQAAGRVAEVVAGGAALCGIVQDPVPREDTVAAAVLFFDEDGRVLLVDPVYKPGWEFPGGVVESGEPPVAAAVREVREELGVESAPGRLRLLFVDWEPHGGPRTGGLRLVFDGGVLDAGARGRLRLPEAELRGWRFVSAEEAGSLLAEGKLRRLRGAIAARAAGVAGYAEGGFTVTG